MLAVVGGKGGCGKTTTTAGLGRAFADAGERPLAVDVDCDMPNLHTVLETDREPGLGALDGTDSLGGLLHGSGRYPGVDVLPAGRATGSADPSALSRLERVGGRVLLDCPAGATEAVARPLRHADRALIVSTSERPSLVDAAKTVRMARALETRVVGGVITRADPDTRHFGPLEAECAILAEIPEVSAARGTVLENPIGRSAYDRLAAEIPTYPR